MSNFKPLFILTPRVSFVTATAVNTTKDGTSGTTYSIWPASGASGSYIRRVTCKPLGTNTASVLRVFINNGSSAGSAANNTYYVDVSLPATTLSEVAGLADVAVLQDIALPSGYNMFCTLGTAVAAGWAICAEGGDY